MATKPGKRETISLVEGFRLMRRDLSDLELAMQQFEGATSLGAQAEATLAYWTARTALNNVLAELDLALIRGQIETQLFLLSDPAPPEVLSPNEAPDA